MTGSALSVGFPSRAADLDIWPGFHQPPAGYGEVPFWWWNGDRLDRDRITWQLDQLVGRGVSGLQVNYAHHYSGGGGYGLTYPSDPALFSPAWWELWDWVADQCRQRGLGLGLSDYTLAWPGNGQWIDRIIADPEFRGAVLEHRISEVTGGDDLSLTYPTVPLCAIAYPVIDGGTDNASAIDLLAHLRSTHLQWTAPMGDWRVVVVWANRVDRSLDPMHPRCGQRVIEEHFSRFTAGRDATTTAGLNFFFQDELMFGVHGNLWSPFLPAAFMERKGYDLLKALPALTCDIGDTTAKIRLDYKDVMTELSENGYFKPIFSWHNDRGMLYGCDQMGRGTQPREYGDYMRAVRWFTAPGHDTPGVGADLVKGKISSSIAHLNQRPRVWLEGYHSAGWGMDPGRILRATLENYAYGCNLLSLHGFYYSTHGSFWEWAPPCYHFRMPYWEHFADGLRGIERLSYILSQGVHRCDVAVLYPVAPCDAELHADAAIETTFDALRTLVSAGLDADVLDHQALESAECKAGGLHLAGEEYRVLVLAGMSAIRHATLLKAVEFRNAGGLVIALGHLPIASDLTGANDPLLNQLVDDLFADERGCVHEKNGGKSVALGSSKAAYDFITRHIVRDCIPSAPCLVLHRHAGERDVYFLVGAQPRSSITVQPTGLVELWNTWDGTRQILTDVTLHDTGTTIVLPAESALGDAWLVVVTPGAMSAPTLPRPAALTTIITVPNAWDFTLAPTLDNRWGDFRLPITEVMIGAEARELRHLPTNQAPPNWQDPVCADHTWPTVRCGTGPLFWQIGPLPADCDAESAIKKIQSLTVTDAGISLSIGKHLLPLKAVESSWRWGIPGDPGDQGYHGLKGLISDDLLALGRMVPPGQYEASGCRYVTETTDGSPGIYIVWTTLVPAHQMTARVICGGLAPTGLWIEGTPVAPDDQLSILPGARLVARYDGPGRAHVVLRDIRSSTPTAHDLATRWWMDAGIIPFATEPHGSSGCYRFQAPPGLTKLMLKSPGQVTAWIDGEKTVCHNTSGDEWTIVLPRVSPSAAIVALLISCSPGTAGGAALPEPIRLTCTTGKSTLGDWSQRGVLADYSGGAWYRSHVAVADLGTKAWLDLGDVSVSAEVHINGHKAGILLAAPWRLDVRRWLQLGDNHIEILVMSTLANHYRTIPTRYRGELRAGLHGPVRLEIMS